MQPKADFTVKQGATANSLQVVLKDATKQPQNISLAQDVVFVMRPYAGGPAIVNASGLLVDDGTEPLRGRADYNWDAADLELAGLFRGEFKVLWPGGTVGKYPSAGWLIVKIEDDNE